MPTFKRDLKPCVAKLYLYHKYLDVWVKVKLRMKLTCRLKKQKCRLRLNF